MYLFKTKNDLNAFLETYKKEGKKIGFVPTMGALHDGHLALVTKARIECDLVVASIFVNPTQFNDPKDFEKYPVTIDQDILKLESAWTDVLFLPSVSEMYPEGINAPHQVYDFGYLETVLEGAYRPGHFQGVGMIVHKLLDLVQPTRLYMGQKDFQQCMIIRKLLEITGIPTELVIVPTKREPNGLAMSSRNTRLSPEEKALSIALYNGLNEIKQNFNQQPISELTMLVSNNLQSIGFQVDYVSIVNGETFEVLDEKIDGKMVGLIAAKIGEIRLIDNMYLN